ncbi:MAG: ABC transporter ATP-binding protein [Pseudomonadota bacterium]
MLRVDRVSAGYGPVQVLHAASLAVAAGEVVCLMGRNGAGKTTLCKAIMRLIPLNTGQILLGDADVGQGAAHGVASLGLGFVPQGRRLFAGLSVAENLEVGLMARRDGAAERAKTLADILSVFPRLGERWHQRAETLSGGEQQMLATARALAVRPHCLLLDEPTEGLQPSMVAEIEAAVVGMKARGVGVLLVEQKVDAVLRLADRVQFIENGETKESVSTDALRNDRELIERYVGV